MQEVINTIAQDAIVPFVIEELTNTKKRNTPAGECTKQANSDGKLNQTIQVKSSALVLHLEIVQQRRMCNAVAIRSEPNKMTKAKSNSSIFLVCKTRLVLTCGINNIAIVHRTK